MPTFDIVKKTKPDKSFRSRSVIDKYDISDAEITEHFKGEIDLTGEWKIGVIWGGSGTGKTVISKKLFPKYYVNGYEYKSRCVLNDFPQNLETEDIFRVLNSVGFSSPPSWLKAYSVLSQGEKMRIDLSRALLTQNKIIVFDEFTSVVDRTVAQIGSYAIAKAIRKSEKKFIAVSCHEDILAWLQPEWDFCTDNMTFSRRRLRRPEIEISIYKEKGKWEFFRKYHYLNHDLNESTDQYVGYIENKPVCFCAVIHQPHGTVKNLFNDTPLFLT